MPEDREARKVHCKEYHAPNWAGDEGQVVPRARMSRDTKSRCPGWTEDRNVRERLIADALKDPDRGDDARGRPKILWNAAEGMYFIGVSTGQQEAVYNCYPEVPATSLYEQLEARARRSVSQVLADNGSEDR